MNLQEAKKRARKIVPNKAGQVSVDKTVDVIVLVVAVLLIVSSLAATLLNATGELGNSGLPLSNLFSGANPVVLVLFMLGIFLGVYGLIRRFSGGRR